MSALSKERLARMRELAEFKTGDPVVPRQDLLALVETAELLARLDEVAQSYVIQIVPPVGKNVVLSVEILIPDQRYGWEGGGGSVETAYEKDGDDETVADLLRDAFADVAPAVEAR
jgi:hypothetical protein